MTGTHGSLWQYLKAYQVYGGKPPIPEESDASRGETRRKVVQYPVMAVTWIIALLPVIPVLPVVGGDTGTVVTGAIAISWIGISHMLLIQVSCPFLDWVEDVPRYGLSGTRDHNSVEEVSGL